MAMNAILTVADLIGRPGASRALAADFAVPEDFALPLSHVLGDLHCDGVIESVVDGILVRGTLTFPLQLTCARCLVAFDQVVSVPVTELYADPAHAEDPADVEEGFELRGDQLDLDAMLRDAVAQAVPTAPHCRPDCCGLCAICGANRNEIDCGCVDERVDSRWAVLASLRLPAADTGDRSRR